MQNALWPDALIEELRAEIDAKLARRISGTLPVALLIAENEHDTPVGFLEIGLRSHADGCDTSHPVGFVEGLWVEADYRNRGIAGDLMRAAEDWARAHGAVEIASDALIGNEPSLRAHLALGFEIVDRCIHLRKPL